MMCLKIYLDRQHRTSAFSVVYHRINLSLSPKLAN